MENFLNMNKRGGWNKNVPGGFFPKNWPRITLPNLEKSVGNRILITFSNFENFGLKVEKKLNFWIFAIFFQVKWSKFWKFGKNKKICFLQNFLNIKYYVLAKNQLSQAFYERVIQKIKKHFSANFWIFRLFRGVKIQKSVIIFQESDSKSWFFA